MSSSGFRRYAAIPISRTLESASVKFIYFSVPLMSPTQILIFLLQSSRTISDAWSGVIADEVLMMYACLSSHAIAIPNIMSSFAMTCIPICPDTSALSDRDLRSSSLFIIIISGLSSLTTGLLSNFLRRLLNPSLLNML